MFKRFNNRTLTVVFAILLVLVVLTQLFDKRNRSGSFKAELTTIDTAKVSSVIIHTKISETPVVLEKIDSKWQIKIDDNRYNADKSMIERMIEEISNLKATRIAAKDKARWSEFQVNDSLGTRVKVLQGKKTAADLYLGKFSFKQSPNVSPYMRQQPQMFTYVRIADENKVYSTEGMIGMSFNRSPEDFRDKTVVKIDKNKIEQIDIKQSGNDLTLKKTDGNWMLNGIIADSAFMAEYVSKLSRLTSSNFTTLEKAASSNATHSLVIKDTVANLIEVKAFPADSVNGYIIESSINPGTYFSGKKAELFQKLFPKEEDFLNPNLE